MSLLLGYLWQLKTALPSYRVSRAIWQMGLVAASARIVSRFAQLHIGTLSALLLGLPLQLIVADGRARAASAAVVRYFHACDESGACLLQDVAQLTQGVSDAVRVPSPLRRPSSGGYEPGQVSAAGGREKHTI
jgi:hypothetical protein